MTDQLSETTDNSNTRLADSRQLEAVKGLQALVDEIVQDEFFPYMGYLRAHQLGLIDSRFVPLDRALDLGLVKIRKA